MLRVSSTRSKKKESRKTRGQKDLKITTREQVFPSLHLCVCLGANPYFSDLGLGSAIVLAQDVVLPKAGNL